MRSRHHRGKTGHTDNGCHGDKQRACGLCIPAEQAVIAEIEARHHRQSRQGVGALAVKCLDADAVPGKRIPAEAVDTDILGQKTGCAQRSNNSQIFPSISGPVNPVHVDAHLHRVAHLADGLLQSLLLLHAGVRIGLGLIQNVGLQLLSHRLPGPAVANLAGQGVQVLMHFHKAHLPSPGPRPGSRSSTPLFSPPERSAPFG